MSVFRLSALPALFMAASAAAAANGAETGPIKIGVAGPVTGSAAANGQDMVSGARAAIDKINAKGGVLGRRLELDIGDDAGSPAQGISVANKMIGDEVHFVVGHYASTITKAVSSRYNEAGIVQITISQAPDILQQNFPNLFRITPNAAELSKGYFDTVKAEFNKGNNKIAIVGTKDSYGESLSDLLQKGLHDIGLPPPVAREGYNPDEQDFSAPITKLKFGGIKLVLLSGSEGQMARFIRQSADQGFKPQFIVSSTALSATFALDTGGCAAKGVKSVAAWNPLYLPGAANEALKADLYKAGVNGIDTGINAYSAVMALAQAMEKAKSADPADVGAVLHRESFDLPIGPTQFTATGELAHPRTIVYEFQSDSTPCQTVFPRPSTP